MVEHQSVLKSWISERKVVIAISWVNIFIQLLFPLSLSFTPAIAARTNTASAYVVTEPYVLGVEESVETIAKRHGLSVVQLKNINNYRTFSKPFTALAAGDELDVPRKRSPFSVDNEKPQPAEAKLAGLAVTSGTALNGGNAAKSAEQIALGTATNTINDSTQQWLGHFGTARVKLNVDNELHLNGSELDLLVPLYEDKKKLLFTQLGVRNKDSRDTFNTGVGFRAFQYDWMFGINSFFDNDITGKNQRMGLGLEAWSDYLRLSTNSYFSLTDWHQSRDFSDYNERPANGFDVRAEAYWPTYPQIGGKLMFEQYRGDNVALFGKDNRQKDPYTVRTGISFTPIPLMTLSAEHRIGKDGLSDANFNLQFNYRYGQSLQSQIDPGSVLASRTLAGSHYNLVERNNNIVLDYKKQNTVSLSLPAQVTGEEGTTVPIVANVTTTHGLDRIEWDSAVLVNAGGNLVQTSPETVLITLPPYQQARSNNIYTISAVAYDRRGNTSPFTSMQLNVTPSTVAIISGNLKVTQNNAVSNGVATNAVQAIVTDANNNPRAGQSVVFSTDDTAIVIKTTGVTDADGLVTATLTSTVAQVSRITASVNGANQSIDVTFIADNENLDPSKSSLSAEPVSILANGKELSTMTLILKDRNDNNVSGQKVLFASDLTNSLITPVVDNGDGTYIATLSGTTSGVANITAQVNGSAFGINLVSVDLTTDESTASIDDTDFIVANGAVANGKALNAISAKVHDAQGNSVSNINVTFTVTSGAATLVGQTSPSKIAMAAQAKLTVQTDASGVATAALVSLVAGDNQVTATVGSHTTAAQT
ncbi:MAG: inverse autotransporter beta domain-containing protein, partial [Chania sp.]